MKKLDFSKLPPAEVKRLAKSLLQNPQQTMMVPACVVMEERASPSPPSALYGVESKKVIRVRVRVRREESARASAPVRTREKANKAVHNNDSHYVKPRLVLTKEVLYYTEQFEIDPKKLWTKKALVVAEKTGAWNGLSLTGQYLVQFEKRFYRPWGGSTPGLVELCRDMTELHKRVGDEAAQAIVAIFSVKMKWVTNHLGLLMSRDGYERFVLPVIALIRDTKKPGEQAEWSGQRSDDDTCEEVRL